MSSAGEWLAEGDLVWRQHRVVGEYQGEEHAARRRRSADAFRRELLTDHGWRVKEIWAEDLHRRARRVATLLSFARALELDPAALRIT
jgi:very-short-patch-repair endonuclease